MARIDDCLIRQGQVQQDLRSLLGREEFAGLFDPNLEALCDAAGASEREVVHALFTLLLEGETGTETLAYILLKDLDSDLAAVRARELLGYPQLTDRQRGRIENILASWSLDLCLREVEGPVTQFQSAEAQRLLALVSRESTEEEELGVLWLWATRMASPPVRVVLMEALFANPSVRPFAAAEVEIAEGDREVVLRMARLLGARKESEAGELLRRLAEHRDLGVRIEADQRSREREAPEIRDERPRFLGARLYDNPSSGVNVVVYAAEDGAGRRKAVAAIVDTWDLGLVDCWGQNRLFPEDVDVVFSCGGRLAPRAGVGELEGRVAAGWLIEGEGLARRRGGELPAQWPIWRRLLRATPDPVAPREVAFGLFCLDCRQPIRRPPPETESDIPLVLGSVALCPECLRSPRHCSGCGQSLEPKAAQAVTHPESPRIEFYCASCHDQRKKR